MTEPAVKKAWYQFTADDWYRFTADEWNYFLAVRIIPSDEIVLDAPYLRMTETRRGPHVKGS